MALRVMAVSRGDAFIVEVTFLDVCINGRRRPTTMALCFLKCQGKTSI